MWGFHQPRWRRNVRGFDFNRAAYVAGQSLGLLAAANRRKFQFEARHRARDEPMEPPSTPEGSRFRSRSRPFMLTFTRTPRFSRYRAKHHPSYRRTTRFRRYYNFRSKKYSPRFQYRLPYSSRIARRQRFLKSFYGPYRRPSVASFRRRSTYGVPFRRRRRLSYY